MNFLPITLLIAFSVQKIYSANILVILPLPLYSFTANYMPVFNGLAARGHNVTLVSPFPQKHPVPNLTDIIFPRLDDKIFDWFRDKDIIKCFRGPWMQMFTFWTRGLVWMETVLEDDTMKKLISDTSSKYDLVIAQIWYLQEYLAAFGHKYNAPVIGISARLIWPLTAYLTGNYLPPAYLPVQSLPFTDRMTLLERALNLLNYWYVWGGQLLFLRAQTVDGTSFHYSYTFSCREKLSFSHKVRTLGHGRFILLSGLKYPHNSESLLREHFNYPGLENLPPLNDMLRNVSLTLMDSSITAIGYPTPLLKNIIEIGAINIEGKLEPLPAELQQFMDNAVEGIIYFSFGSIFNFSHTHSSKMEAIISALGKVQQNVLMKIETTNPLINSTKPNILARQWFPQPSILAHPNCQLFVTHGGLHSLMEAVYLRVPMVVIPLVADQQFNGRLIETFGIGRAIQLEETTEHKLLEVVNSVLSNISYKENINRRSAIMKDTPIDPFDNTIYWIEYVIRHKGAPHLRPAVLDLHWYQYLMLDVIALYLLIMTLFIMILIGLSTIIFKLIKCVLKICCDGRDSFGNQEKKSKKE